MLSSCLMGQTGPLSGFVGFGNMAAAVSGFYNLCGWPDRAPSGPYGAYTDYVAPRFGAVSVLAALDYRRRTGKGQYIDQSQAESALHFLSPALLDCATNGRVGQGTGNADPNYAPHGVYPALGENGWVAIACLTDEHWQALCFLMGNAALANDSRFATLRDRLINRAALDEVLGSWTKGMSSRDAENLLQSKGIPAGTVEDSKGVCLDEQLAARGYLVDIEHPTLGRTAVEGSRFILSRTPAVPPRPAPTVGGDNEHVLQDILGYSEEKISELVALGAVH